LNESSHTKEGFPSGITTIGEVWPTQGPIDDGV